MSHSVGTVQYTQPKSQLTGQAKEVADQKNNLLKLMIAQMQSSMSAFNSEQDPSDAVRDHAIFTQVELLLDIKSLLKEKMSTEDTKETSITADKLQGFLGTHVSGRDTGEIELDAANEPEITYVVPEDAPQVTVLVKNFQNEIVMAKDGVCKKGAHSFTWKGLNADGKRQLPGTYHVEVIAWDSQFVPKKIPLQIEGVVNGYDAERGVLLVGDLMAPMRIDQIRTGKRHDNEHA